MSAPASTPNRHATHPFSRRNGLPARSGQESQSSLWLPGKADEGENQPARDPAAWDGFRPELVLLEIDLPGMEGYEVARRLWAQPGSEDLLLVALTALAQ